MTAQRVVRLDSLHPEARRVVMALVEAARAAKEAKEEATVVIAEKPSIEVPDGQRNYRYEYVRAADLKVDTSYHSAERFSETRARRMAADFHEEALGVITVSLRDGIMVLIDGNHRRYAALENGVTYLYAKVYFGLTRSEEAALFVQLSAAVPLQTLDLWMARREARDPIVIGVETALAPHNIRVVRGGASSSPHSTRSVAVLERIYRVDPELLRDTLAMVRAAWPEDPKSTDALPISAVASFLYCYRRTTPRVDERHLAQRLALTPVVQLYRQEQLERSTSGGTGGALSRTGKVSLSVYVHARNALLTIYNRGLRRTRLFRLTLRDLRAMQDGRIVDLSGRDDT